MIWLYQFYSAAHILLLCNKKYIVFVLPLKIGHLLGADPTNDAVVRRAK